MSLPAGSSMPQSFGGNEDGRVDVRAGDVADCVDHAGYDESGRQGVADDSQASAGDFVGHCRPGRDEDQRKGSDALGGGAPLQRIAHLRYGPGADDSWISTCSPVTRYITRSAMLVARSAMRSSRWATHRRYVALVIVRGSSIMKVRSSR